MAIIAVESIDQRTMTRRSGSVTMEREFKVYADGAGTTPISGSSAARDRSTVGLGDAHPEDSQFIAVDYTVRQHDGERAFWLVRWIYKNIVIAPPGGVGDDEIGYVKVDTDTSVEFDDFYRRENQAGTFWPSIIIPAGGEVPGTPVSEAEADAADIAGMRMDEGGNPVSMPVRKVVFNVTHVRTAFTQADLLTIAFLVGRRNSVHFPPLTLGGASDVGTLVYLGAKSSDMGDGKTRVVHKFVADEYNHLRQVAMADGDGEVILETAINPDYPGQHAKWVFWVQPFDFPKADFALLNIPFIT